MQSQYLELQAIANKMQSLADEAFKREKTEAIVWIKTQMSLYDLTVAQISEKKTKKVVKSVKKSSMNESKDFHGLSFSKKSVESCKKLSIALKGRVITEEHRSKISASVSKRATPSRLGQPIRINGVNYSSYVAAGKALGLAPGVVRQRCYNPHLQFNSWIVLSEQISYLKTA
jgi:hypothetical protein